MRHVLLALVAVPSCVVFKCGHIALPLVFILTLLGYIPALTLLYCTVAYVVSFLVLAVCYH